MTVSSRRRLLPLIVATTMTGITTNTLIGPAVPEIIDAFGAGDGAAGLIVAAGSLPGLLVAPTIGFLADRFGRREVLVPCLALFGVAGGLAGLAPSLAALVALRVLQGVGSAGLINLAVVVIGDHWHGIDRARMIGRNSALLTVCLAVFPFVGGVLTDLGGWRLPFAIYPLGLLTAAFAWRRLERGERHPAGARDQLRAVLPVLRDRRFAGVAFGTVVVFALIFGVVLTVLPVYAERVFGLGATARGVLLGLPSLGSTTTALLSGRLVARHGRRRVLLAASLLFAVSLALLAGVPTLPATALAIVLFGAGEGAFVPLVQDLAAGLGGTEQRGTLVATQVGMARLGQTLGPLTIAPLASTASPAAAFAAGAALAAGPLVAASLVATTRPSGEDPPEGARREGST